MAKQSIRSIRKGSVQWNEEDRLQMVSMLGKSRICSAGCEKRSSCRRDQKNNPV